jgi:hypothetical protein
MNLIKILTPDSREDLNLIKILTPGGSEAVGFDKDIDS